MEASTKSLEYIDLLQQVSREVGFPLGAASTGGASDANLTAAAGTPTIDGLGLHGGRAHSAEEFIEIPSVTAKCEVLAGFLGSLAAGAAQGSDVG
jgi:glutamate carboxypeptidase